MRQPTLANLPMHISELETPTLLIDLDRMERNLDRAAAYCAKHNLRMRPHTKTHKTPEIGHMQLDRGAVGLTVAKVGEDRKELDAFEERKGAVLRFFEDSLVEPDPAQLTVDEERGVIGIDRLAASGYSALFVNRGHLNSSRRQGADAEPASSDGALSARATGSSLTPRGGFVNALM